jgi:hypothetical protein
MRDLFCMASPTRIDLRFGLDGDSILRGGGGGEGWY